MLVNHVGTGVRFNRARAFAASARCRARRQKGDTCARWSLLVMHEVMLGRPCTVDELAPLVAYCRAQLAPETVAQALEQALKQAAAGSLPAIVRSLVKVEAPRYLSVDALDEALARGPCVVGLMGAYQSGGYWLARRGCRTAHAIVCVGHVVVGGVPAFVFRDSNRRGRAGDYCFLPRDRVADPVSLDDCDNLDVIYAHLSAAGQVVIDELFAVGPPDPPDPPCPVDPPGPVDPPRPGPV